MIDVAHNGDNRRSGSQILLAVCEVFDSFFRFLFFDLADDDLFAQFVTEDLDGIFIQILIDISHNAHLHEGHDEFRG